MLILTGRAEIERGLTLPLAVDLHDLIAIRLERFTAGEHDLADMTVIVVLEAGDTDADLQAGAGVSLLTNVLNGAAYPAPDYVAPIDYLHWATPDVCEAIVCVGNSGYAVHVLIPVGRETASDLLAWCREYAK